jgi:hypothetical protein
MTTAPRPRAKTLAKQIAQAQRTLAMLDEMEAIAYKYESDNDIDRINRDRIEWEEEVEYLMTTAIESGYSYEDIEGAR